MISFVALRAAARLRPVFRSIFNLRSFLGLCLLLLGGGLTTARAQSAQYTENKPDQALKRDARVDPATLGMSVELPLSGAAGRAGTSLPVSLRYSSKVWRIAYAGSVYGYTSQVKQTRAKFAEHSTAGWTSSLTQPWLEYTGQSQLYDAAGNALNELNETESTVYYVKRLTLHLPDGSSHELRKEDAPAALDRTNPSYDWTGSFSAPDGSRLRFDFATRTLYLPDGGSYQFGADESRQDRTGEWREGLWAQAYRDRHGNTLVYNSASREWTDTLGRVWKDYLPDNPAAGEVTNFPVPGVGGGTLTYKLRWQQLSTVLRDPGVQLKSTGNIHCGTPNSAISGGGLFNANGTTVMCGEADANHNGIPFNPVVLAEMELPNGTKYEFKYNEYGEIEQLRLPGGGYERYGYDKVPATGHLGVPYDQGNRGVVQRWISPNGAPGEEATHQWSYSASFVYPHNLVTTTAPDGSRSERLVYVAASHAAYDYESVLAGMALEERSYSAANVMLRRSLTQWEVGSGVYGAQRDPRVTKQVSLILDTGGDALAQTTELEYDGDWNVIATKHSAFAAVNNATAQTAAIGSIPTGALERREETTFLVNDANVAQSVRDAYRARNLLGLPTSTRVRNAAGTIVAQSEIRYDEAAYGILNYGGAAGWTDPQTTARGNVTTTRAWLDTGNLWLETHAQYDNFGNLRKTWDARGSLTTTEYSASYQFAYPTQVTSAVPDAQGYYGSNQSLTTTATYDYTTGLPTSATDADGNTATTEYDSLSRPFRVTPPAGASVSETTYGTTPGNLYVKTRVQRDANRWIESYTFFDGLGRALRSATQTDGASSLDAAQTWLIAETQYDNLGRVWRVANPWGAGSATASGNPAGLWTTSTYDALGRVLTVTTPDGAQVQSAYDGAFVTVTDQAGKPRRSLTDALGRLIRVDEPDAATGALGSTASPVQATNYAYDVLGNLRRVEQGGQNRYFMYDSLSRLLRAKNPEQNAGAGVSNLSDPVTGNGQWSLGYNYDANGNLNERTDAREVTAHYQYDALNRNVRVWYTGEGAAGYGGYLTPEVRRYYDGKCGGNYALFDCGSVSVANAKGKLWRTETVGQSLMTVTGYDGLGRPQAQQQRFWQTVNGISGWSNGYTTARSYDSLSHVTGQTYPSGHAVAYNYDAAGRLADADATHQAFTGNLGDGISRTYALGVKYEERGMLAREGFGTSSPLWHKRQYNVRGQVWNIQLGAGASATGENHSYPGGRVQLYYGGAAEGQSSATNNGNVTAQYRVAMSGAGGGPLEWWEGYSYDALNRLTQVTEYSGAAGWQATGQQAYVYDRWGNRTIHQSNTWGVGIPKPNLAIETATNRLLPGSGQTGGFAYDAAGNLTTDTVTVAGGGQRFYDAENRIWKAQNLDGSFTEYRYDGDGRRIKRFVNANAYQQPETWQIYGMDGELAAEYRQGYAPFVPSKEYGYRNGQLLITAANGDEQRLTNYVAQLYYRAGGYSSANVQTQVNTLANAGAQGETQLRTAAQTVVRQIYQASTLPAGDLVAALYLGVLQRYGDAGGLAYWTSVAQSDRNGVIEAFIAPGEFDQRVQVLFGRELSDVERTDNFTKYLYTTILNRGASATEKSDRRAAVDGASAQGQSSVVTNAKDFARSLFNGAEYAARNRTNSEFVADLYFAFLRYAPDAGGWNYWTGVVNSNGRAGVLETFLNAGAFDVAAGALYREVLWLVADHLGTPRMIAERSGQPAGIKHHDYLPFGEELFGGISGRDASHGYGAADSARQQFTAYERDDETGLDYAQERYYSNAMGRFISTDPLGASADTADPQSFNRYIYVSNNPLRYVDPDGMKPQTPWEQLTEAEQKAISGKLTKKDKEDDAAAFNRIVSEGANTPKELSKNLASIRNFIAGAGGLTNSGVWQQIKTIDQVVLHGQNSSSSINLTVNNRKDFIAALEQEGYAVNNPLFTKFEEKRVDSAREKTDLSSDPALHFESKEEGTNYSAHWDATSTHFRNTRLRFMHDRVNETIWAGALHNFYYKDGPSPGTVRQYQKRKGLVPTQ